MAKQKRVRPDLESRAVRIASALVRTHSDTTGRAILPAVSTYTSETAGLTAQEEAKTLAKVCGLLTYAVQRLSSGVDGNTHRQQVADEISAYATGQAFFKRGDVHVQ